jgi:hypothetical protein
MVAVATNDRDAVRNLRLHRAAQSVTIGAAEIAMATAGAAVVAKAADAAAGAMVLRRFSKVQTRFRYHSRWHVPDRIGAETVAVVVAVDAATDAGSSLRAGQCPRAMLLRLRLQRRAQPRRHVPRARTVVESGLAAVAQTASRTKPEPGRAFVHQNTSFHEHDCPVQPFVSRPRI